MAKPVIILIGETDFQRRGVSKFHAAQPPTRIVPITALTGFFGGAYSYQVCEATQGRARMVVVCGCRRVGADQVHPPA
jgi:hypothetical protein